MIMLAYYVQSWNALFTILMLITAFVCQTYPGPQIFYLHKGSDLINLNDEVANYGGGLPSHS